MKHLRRTTKPLPIKASEGQYVPEGKDTSLSQFLKSLLLGSP